MVTRSKGYFLAGLMLALNMTHVQALEFEGFGSISYHKHDVDGHHAAGSGEYPEGFTLGGFNLYAFQQISDNSSAFAEFIIGDYTEEIELERLWIKRTFAPAFEIKAGLVESPLGYWNRTYHQGGQLLQDTITRPVFLNYEDQDGAIFPMVSVGIEAAGSIPLGRGELDYVGVFSNGSSLNTGAAAHGATHDESSKIEINSLGDPGDDKLFLLRTAYRFSGIPLQIGLFGMNNPVVQSGEGNPEVVFADGTRYQTEHGSLLVSQTVLGADIHFSLNGFETIAEYYSINNDDRVGSFGSDSAQAWYIHFGYQLTERFKPVYRYVSVELNKNDPYFHYLGMQEQEHHVVGLRYDLDESNALKFEIHQMKFDNGEEATHSELQWAFLMF